MDKMDKIEDARPEVDGTNRKRAGRTRKGTPRKRKRGKGKGKGSHSFVRAGKALAAARAEAQLTSKELGDLVGVDGSMVTRWENGISAPVRANWDKVVELLPSLGRLRPRGLRDQAKPGPSNGSNGSNGTKSQKASYVEKCSLCGEKVRMEGRDAVDAHGGLYCQKPTDADVRHEVESPVPKFTQQQRQVLLDDHRAHESTAPQARPDVAKLLKMMEILLDLDLDREQFEAFFKIMSYAAKVGKW